ncbi:hypothetical protein DOY81_006162 [Sarcophaga bullata]|nr:hypothetical protein DOY81_006162 [Sarcophaga bullata]
MWFKFKNVATIIIETFHLLLITILLGNPFNVKQIDDIVVMASTAKITLATIIANSGGSSGIGGLKQHHTSHFPHQHNQQQHQHQHQYPPQQQYTMAAVAATATATTTTITSATSLSTPAMPAIASASASSLNASLFVLQASSANNLYNSTFAQVIDRNDSNEIDTLSNDSDNYDRGLSKNFIRTKHIALPGDLTQLQQQRQKMSTTKLIMPTIEPETTVTKTTSTTRKLLSMSSSSESSSSSSSSTSLMSSSSMSSILMPDDQTRQHLSSRTQLDVLTSLSLLSSSSLLSLSLNDTMAPITTELQSLSSTLFASTATSAISSSSSSTTASASTSTLTFPKNEEAATALGHQGNEQNMHNTNSHLTVDNVNATIVSNNNNNNNNNYDRTTKTLERQQQQQQQKHSKDTTIKLSSQKNTSSIAKGSSKIDSSNTISTSDSGSLQDDSNSSSSTSSSSTSSSSNSSRNSSTSHTNTGTTRISARKVDSKYILSKAHKTDAPMLNYIFDTFSSANKHHHHDQRYGPHFEDVQLVGQPTNMTVQAGSSIHLNCRISLLQDKTVSWVRRNAQGENALDLLTVGLHTYTGDKRYKMEFQYPSNWRLKINNVKKDDEATYECQISTHPPRVIQINLHVNAPKVMIVDEFGDPLQEKYYEQDSTLQLSCVVRNVAMSSSVVFWKHSEDILNYDVTRGGVSVKTELMDDGANSTLFIAKINKADSGNYTCSISEYQNYTIVVHILNGESFAELHHGAGFSWQQLKQQNWLINLVLAIILLLLLPAYIHR